MTQEIAAYIDLVRGGEYPACREQLALCDYVERVFASEEIHVDEAQLARYFALQKYFPFELFPWERFVFALHNCTYRPDGALRWPEALIYVGRGAGKNGYLSFEDFCLLTPVNGIPRYRIDICATSEEQARTSFDDVLDVLETHEKKMRTHFHWTKETIDSLKTKSSLCFRTANYKTKDGGRPGKVDFDELHQYEDYRLLDVMRTGLGKTPGWRSTYITTDGNVRGGPLDDLLATARGILFSDQPDNGLLPFLCCLDDKKEVTDPRNWHKANPSLRYLPVLMDRMQAEYADYQRNQLGNAGFMTKRMNCPIGNPEAQVTSWENILATNRPLPEALDGAWCVSGVDYAKTNDFVAAGLLFSLGDIWYWLTHTWVCRECADLSKIRFPLAEAEERGLLTMVSAPQIAPELPAQWLAEQAQHYSILGLAIDDYRFALLKKALAEVGFIVDKQNGNIKLVRPRDIMQVSPVIASRFSDHKIVYGDNALMRWYTNNAKSVMDSKGNVTYGKIEPHARKTDGFMAFVAAATLAEELERYGAELGEMPVYTY